MSEIEKIRELLSKSESRIADLEKSIRTARDTFSSEGRKVIEVIARVSADLDDWNRKMKMHDENVSRLEEERKAKRSEVDRAEQKTKELEKKQSSAASETKSAEKEIVKAQSTLHQYETKIEALKEELERSNKETNDLSAAIETMKKANEREFDVLEKEKNEFQEKFKELSEKEPLTHLVLTEAQTEPPDVMIVAKLMKENGQILIDDIKRTTKINPAIAAKTIEALEQKGVVSKIENDKVRLTKR